MKKNPIGIVDSGIGGSSILNSLSNLLPNENYVFYADTKFAPYGKRTKFEIKQRMDKIVFKLITTYKIKCLVIGCNTASAIASKSLREKYKLPIIAVEPPVNLIKDKLSKTLIMGTRHTLKRKNIQEILQKRKNYKPLYISNLAKMIDSNLNDLNKIIPFLKCKMQKYEDFENIVLGCTHYNFIKQQIRYIFPKANIISCEKEISKQVEKILLKNDLINDSKSKGHLEVVMSKYNEEMKKFIYNNYFFQSNNRK